MKKSNYTEEQIAFALKQAELGTPVEEGCRKMGISDATFYNWRKKFGGLGPAEVRRLKQLEENLRRDRVGLGAAKTEHSFGRIPINGGPSPAQILSRLPSRSR